jgi:hypothetical protein
MASSKKKPAKQVAAAPVEEEDEEQEEAPVAAEESEEAVGDKPDADEADEAESEKVEDKPTEAKKETEEEKEESVKSEVDYKAAYEKLLAPFKANGREINVESVDDAISLMQMGANYNKKMAALKPNLKLLKMLENNGLLNEDRLSFLIDLEKKNPEAINKLVKDSGIDPLDLNAEKAGEYKPKTYTVDDKEIELETVLEEIKETPSYSRTLDVVSNKWDSTSKQVIAGTPQILKILNSHIQSGVFDVIHKEVERERMFGRLSGLSDLDAYKQVGDAIQARGGFNHLGNQGNQTPSQPVVVQPKPKLAETDKLRDKKLAASTSKPAGSSTSVKEYNPLSMSDEEFSKLVNHKYL